MKNQQKWIALCFFTCFLGLLVGFSAGKQVERGRALDAFHESFRFTFKAVMDHEPMLMIATTAEELEEITEMDKKEKYEKSGKLEGINFLYENFLPQLQQ